MTAEETIASVDAQLKRALEQQFRIIFERLNTVKTQEAHTPYD